MFYSQCLLSRKGPLGAIWVAAYFFKKLKKTQINETDIPSSVDEILQNELDAVAYRVLAYLLLGVVRIYSKKVDYLLDDCNKVLINIRDFVIKEKNRAQKANASLPFSTIALPKSFELDAFDLGILEDFHGDNIKLQEEITLKEGGWQNERMGQHLMDKFDFEDTAPFTSNETCSADHDEIEGKGSACAMDIGVENVRSVQEENAIRKTFVIAEEEPSDPIESSGNHLTAYKHSANSQPDKMLEEVSWERIRHNGFLIDKCISPDKIYGVEINIPGYAEYVSKMCHDMENPSNLPENFEKPLDCSDEERLAFEMLHGTEKEPFEVAQPHQEETHTCSKIEGSCDMTFSKDGDSQVDAKDTPVLVTPEAPPQLKIPEALDATTPQFTVIPTPAAKEGAWVSRKRKCLIDSAVIVPNKFMKQWIEDSSELIRKRRKIPQTPLAAWRTSRFSNLSQCLFEPLIPYASLELQSLSSQGKLTSLELAVPVKPRKPGVTETPTDAGTSEQMENAPLKRLGILSAVVDPELPEAEIMETPQAAVITAERMVNTPEIVESHRASGTAEQTEIASGTVGTPKAAGTSEHVEIAPETPVRESKLKRFFKIPDSPSDKEVRTPNSFGCFDEEPETSSWDKDLDMILMHEELVSASEREDSPDGWSGRTRTVARYLEKTFLNQKERGDEEMVSLLLLCRGRTRKGNARLFYETLVLKTKGYVDLKQKCPYGDVLLIHVTGQQEARETAVA